MKKRILGEIIFKLFFTIILISWGTLSMGCSNHESAYPEDVDTPLWKANNVRNKIVTISDLHIGIEDRYSETVKNRPLLIEFLRRLHNTKDVRELVIIGDFLDEWYLPVSYPDYTDEAQFYKGVLVNNMDVINELKHIVNSGIKLVYIPGNHDVTLEQKTLQEAIPGIVQARDARGVGTYYTGDRKEIAIEHGHRYDVFCAPDAVSNKELCANDNTILPVGYFYAKYMVTWIYEGMPKVVKDYPVITDVPEKSDTDRYGAYLYYSLMSKISAQFTINEPMDQKIFKMHFAGFDDDYSFLDLYPQMQPDGTISAKLYKNIQRTWGERQKQNKVKITNDFFTALAGALDWDYYYAQAKTQYLENPNENVDVVVFGHTHVPAYHTISGDKCYVNDGTWVDNNTDSPQFTRTFAVITVGEKDTVGLYMYGENGSITDIGTELSKE